MYGLDESGCYSIDIPNVPTIPALKSAMTKGHIVHLCAKALDDPRSFEGCKIVNIKVLSIEEEQKNAWCNFKVLIMDDPNRKMSGSLVTSAKYCEGFIQLHLSWGNSGKTVDNMNAIIDIVKNRSFSAAERLTYKSYN